MPRRWPADDFTPPPDPVEALPLFAEPEPFPTRPEVKRAEQRELAIARTPEAILAAWRATEEGAEVYAWIVTRALEEVAQGATRLSSKHLLEDARYHFKRAVDNRVTSALSRAIIDEHPWLAEFFQLRQRSA